jgi:hypothetical protein
VNCNWYFVALYSVLNVGWCSKHKDKHGMNDKKNVLLIVPEFMVLIFSFVTPCCFVNGYKHLEQSCYFHLQGIK